MKQLNNYILEKLHLNDKTEVYPHYPSPKTKDELEELLVLLIKERGSDADLNDVDVSNITDMHALFSDVEDETYPLRIKNIHIEDWDVSNVTDMSNMFEHCINFECNLDNWDVKPGVNKKYMFNGCRIYPKPMWYA